jgi:hypothetical protein
MKKLEKFDYDVADVAADFKKQDSPIISTLVQSSGLLDFLTIYPNVKGKSKIKILDAVAIFKPESCTFDPSGDAVLTEKELSVTGLDHDFTLCGKDLIGTWGEVYLAAGANKENITLNDLTAAVIAQLVKREKNGLERLIMLGDTGSGNAQLAFHDGLVKIINDSADVTEVTIPLNGAVAADATDTTQALGILNTVAAGIPTEVFDAGLTYSLHVSRTVYEAVKQNIFTANNFGYVLNEVNPRKSYSNFALPVSGVTIVANPYLQGMNTTILGLPKELTIWGTDLEEDMNAMQLVPDPFGKALNGTMAFKTGVQIALDVNFVKTTFTQPA